MLDLTREGMFIADWIILCLSLFVAALYFVVNYAKAIAHSPTGILAYAKSNPKVLLVTFLFAVAFALRVSFVDLLPRGFNQDEASIGYEAWSILHYGIDRKGNFLPVHLVSWGSGQNAFYAYFIIPFVALLGLNELSVRLPMGLLSCLSCFLVFRMIRKTGKENMAIAVLAFLAIAPWDIMRSRWALESNAFPSLLVCGTYLLQAGLSFRSAKGINARRTIPLALSAIVFGLSAYSYGTSYLFLLLYLGIAFAILVFRKKMSLLEAIGFVVLSVLVALPIILFIWINLFDGETFRFLGFTIPKLNQDRFHATTNLFSSDFFRTALENFGQGLRILFLQTDGLSFNGIDIFGTIYVFSTPFALFGLFHKSENESESNLLTLLRVWIGVSLLMLLVISPNINRINFLFPPLIILTGIGLYDTVGRKRQLAIASSALYVGAFAFFLSTYTGKWNTDNGLYSFRVSLGQAIDYVSSIKDYDTCYVTSHAGEGAIYMLFYQEIDPYRYLETVDIAGEPNTAAFEHINSFLDFDFNGIPNHIEEGNVYILCKNYDHAFDNLDLSKYKVVDFELYWVVNAVID